MEYVFALAGLAWAFCGALVLGLSVSATHEILACLAISFGVMFLGLSALLRQIRTLNAPWGSAHLPIGPPPIPIEPEVSIEEAIDDVRTTVRLAEREAWFQSFQSWFDARGSEMGARNADDVAHQHTAYPLPAQYFAGLLPPPSPASAEPVEAEYYVERPRTEAQQNSN